MCFPHFFLSGIVRSWENKRGWCWRSSSPNCSLSCDSIGTSSPNRSLVTSPIPGWPFSASQCCGPFTNSPIAESYVWDWEIARRPTRDWTLRRPVWRIARWRRTPRMRGQPPCSGCGILIKLRPSNTLLVGRILRLVDMILYWIGFFHAYPVWSQPKITIIITWFALSFYSIIVTLLSVKRKKFTGFFFRIVRVHKFVHGGGRFPEKLCFYPWLIDWLIGLVYYAVDREEAWKQPCLPHGFRLCVTPHPKTLPYRTNVASIKKKIWKKIQWFWNVVPFFVKQQSKTSMFFEHSFEIKFLHITADVSRFAVKFIQINTNYHFFQILFIFQMDKSDFRFCWLFPSKNIKYTQKNHISINAWLVLQCVE